MGTRMIETPVTRKPKTIGILLPKVSKITPMKMDSMITVPSA
jgi:hypothetical protein